MVSYSSRCVLWELSVFMSQLQNKNRVDGKLLFGSFWSLSRIVVDVTYSFSVLMNLCLSSLKALQISLFFTSLFCSSCDDRACVISTWITVTKPNNQKICFLFCVSIIVNFFVDFSPVPLYYCFAFFLSLQGCRMDEQRCPLPPPLKVSHKSSPLPTEHSVVKHQLQQSYKPFLISCQTGFRMLSGWVRYSAGLGLQIRKCPVTCEGWCGWLWRCTQQEIWGWVRSSREWSLIISRRKQSNSVKLAGNRRSPGFINKGVLKV